MLQVVEYSPGKFLKWFLRVNDFNSVIRRGQLVKTRKAKVLLMLSLGFYIFATVLGVWLLTTSWWLTGLWLVVFQPYLNGCILALVVFVGFRLLNISRRPLLGQANAVLKDHKAVKIAVLGSYGKTTMKELLKTVLEEAKRVQATPGNMNVPISHARWVVKRVKPDTEVLVFEYGEGQPGDIATFAKLTHPDYAVLTGLAPNHLDKYPNLEAVAQDLASIGKFVDSKRLYLNADAPVLIERLPEAQAYGPDSVGGWYVTDISVDYAGITFTMKKAKKSLNIKSKLLGKHQVGPLAAVAALAAELGLSKDEIEKGIAKTQSFEHRMQARQQHGAWIIDDTYNGNLEGIRAGLALLGDLKAKRKIYVTPGLVDQGEEAEAVHREIGQLIAKASPDKVVLMQNSATDYIKDSLLAAGYKGDLEIQDDPLSYYTNLEHILAAGDLIVLQNDWTDNYN